MSIWNSQIKSQTPRTVLIISRDTRMVSAWEVLFGMRNVYVIHESSPRCALQSANLTQPALVIIDMDMPQQERIAFCRALRSATRGAMFILAPKISESNTAEYYQAGVDEYLSPSISPISLIARAMVWLSKMDVSIPPQAAYA